MSRIDRLVEDLCPDGVPYVSITEVSDYIRGITYNKNDETAEGEISVLRANNITLASNTLNFTDVKSVSGRVRVRENQHLRAGDILVCAGSGSKEHIGKVAYIDSDRNETFGGFMAVVRTKDSNRLEPRFVFHLLTGGTFSSYLRSTLSTTTINNLNSGVMRGYRIPLPPLEIQREIVRVLDQFSQLEAELEAELEARRVQYAYYRDELVGKRHFVTNDWVELESIASIKTGSKPLEIAEVGNVPYINAGNEPSGYVDGPNTRGGVITIPSRGQGGAGHVGYQADDFWCGPLCYRIDNTSRSRSNRFLYYFLRNIQDELVGLRKVGSIPAVNKSDLGKVLVPVVSSDDQERITALLDRFDTLVNDLSIGLPAELAARRKQYEYYRGKLLNFKEAKA